MNKKDVIGLSLGIGLMSIVVLGLLIKALIELFTQINVEPYMYIQCSVWILLLFFDIFIIVTSIKDYVTRKRHQASLDKLIDELDKIINFDEFMLNCLENVEIEGTDNEELTH